MGKVIRFTVPGPPTGKPRMTRGDRWKKRPCVLRYWAWADLARMCAKAAGCPTDSKQIASLSWVAYFAPPESKQDRLGKLHQQKPDRDNVDKALLDALFTDDSGIAKGTLEKRWAKVSRLEVTVEVS
jgi:Holliday junction resolvase RusA-like endonuclease